MLAACWGENAYIVEGTVIEVRSETQLVVDHEPIEGLMGAMVMTFRTSDGATPKGLRRGDQIYARLMMKEEGPVLEKIRVTGHMPLPEPKKPSGPMPLMPGEMLPATTMPVHGGGSWTIGEGQPKATAVTFVYTTCPFPEFCPAIVMRMQGLQAALGQDARILAVTIDPNGDTLDVMSAYADKVAANKDIWRFGRLVGPEFRDLVMRASLPISHDGEDVAHGIRLLVLDAEGRMVERYDDNNWPVERVVQQLKTGAPKASSGSSGTIYPEPAAASE
jgi:protein SCO1/2